MLVRIAYICATFMHYLLTSKPKKFIDTDNAYSFFSVEVLPIVKIRQLINVPVTRMTTSVQ